VVSSSNVLPYLTDTPQTVSTMRAMPPSSKTAEMSSRGSSINSPVGVRRVMSEVVRYIGHPHA
jgi:hypothetical protein